MFHAKLFFYHPALLCHAILLGPREKLFYHYAPLWEGMVFSFQNLFYHPSLLYQSMLFQSMLLGGGRCCMPSFSFIIPHCPIIPYYWTNYSTLIHPFGGDWFYFFLSRVSSIILHCSINPCCWEGVDVACQTFHLSSCIALSPILLGQILYPF